VSVWGLWNEPNFGEDLAPQAIDNDAIEVSVPRYRRLLAHAWRALSATGHRRDTILIGDSAPHGHPHPIGNFDLIAPLRFIRVLYCLGRQWRPLRGLAASERGCPATASGARRFRRRNPALFEATGFAIHPYAGYAPPDRSEPGSIKGAADLAAIPEVERTLDTVFRAYGDRRRIPLYDTEYGYQISVRVPAALAAKYINWAEYISYRNPRVKSYAQYLLDDPANGRFETGLFDSGGRPKPAMAAYRMPLFMPVTSVRRPRRLRVWGAVRPAGFAALDTGQTEQAQVQFAPRDAATFAPIAVVTIRNPRGYFDVRLRFVRSGLLRVAWTDTSGTTFYSRTVQVDVRSALGSGPDIRP
jgi:hypothetical protein